MTAPETLDMTSRASEGRSRASTGTLDTVTVANQDTNLSQHTETWNLDAVGNWTGLSAIVTDGTAQSRTIDARNRYTAVGSATPTWDNNGNLTQDETGLKYVYDVWNRIVKVENSSSSVLETYTYDAMGRRITETPTGQTTKDLYFNTDGNVIEEQQAGTTTNQYVWGLGHQNDLVLRDDNSTSGSYGKSNSGLGRRVFVQQDANWNVTSLVDPSGNVQERFVYDPYGRVQVVDKSTWNASTDSFNWIYHFQGGRQDPVSGLVHFGMPGRDYSTTLGRWTEQDAAGYVDGANMYQFLGDSPTDRLDPTGSVYVPRLIDGPRGNMSEDQHLGEEQHGVFSRNDYMSYTWYSYANDYSIRLRNITFGIYGWGKFADASLVDISRRVHIFVVTTNCKPKIFATVQGKPAQRSGIVSAGLAVHTARDGDDTLTVEASYASVLDPEGGELKLGGKLAGAPIEGGPGGELSIEWTIPKGAKQEDTEERQWVYKAVDDANPDMQR